MAIAVDKVAPAIDKDLVALIEHYIDADLQTPAGVIDAINLAKSYADGSISPSHTAYAFRGNCSAPSISDVGELRRRYQLAGWYDLKFTRMINPDNWCIILVKE